MVKYIRAGQARLSPKPAHLLIGPNFNAQAKPKAGLVGPAHEHPCPQVAKKKKKKSVIYQAPTHNGPLPQREFY